MKATSLALGFYARHPATMDELIDSEDFGPSFVDFAREHELPAELVHTVRRHEALMEKVVEEAIADLFEWETTSRKAVLALVGEDRQPSRWSTPSWGTTIRCRSPLVGALVVELGWSWRTIKDRLFVMPYVWRQGGRRAEQLLLTEVGAWSPGLDLHPAAKLDGWQSGAVRLAHIDVAEFVEEEFQLNLCTWQEAFLQAFAWVTAERLDQLAAPASEPRGAAL